MVDASSDFKFARALCRVELGRTKLLCFFLFAVCAGKHDNFASHLGSKLNSEVSKAADPHDTNAVGGSNVRVQWVEHGGSSTHERGCFCRGDRLGDMEEECSFPNGVRGKRALVQVNLAVHGALITEHLVPVQTLVTVHTAIVQVPPAGTIPADWVCKHKGSASPFEEKYVHFERVDLRTDLLNDPYTFMTEHHVDRLVVLVGAAQSCVGDLEEDFIRAEFVPVPLGLDDFSGWVTLVYGIVQIQLHREKASEEAAP